MKEREREREREREELKEREGERECVKFSDNSETTDSKKNSRVSLYRESRKRAQRWKERERGEIDTKKKRK